MGLVQAEITLKNLYDEEFARQGYIKPEDIRTATVTAIVDTGSMYLVISEDLRQKLGLKVVEDRTANIANGQKIKSHITDSVEIKWKNRRTTLPAMVIPGAEKILLGFLALEAMDLMVNPVTQEVVGVHGDEIEYLAL
jgi:clan AA aspartic protease